MPHANVCRVRIGELVADTSAGRARLEDDARKRVRDPAGVRTLDAVRPWRDEHDPLEQVPELQRATQATDAAHDVEMAVERWESQANVRFASRWLGGRWGQPCRLFFVVRKEQLEFAAAPSPSYAKCTDAKFSAYAVDLLLLQDR